MEFEGAHLRERAREGGYVEWWIVIVERWVLDSPPRRTELTAALEYELGQPVVLMAQDGRGMPWYWGREDLRNYMAKVALEAVPWRKFTLRAA